MTFCSLYHVFVPTSYELTMPNLCLKADSSNIQYTNSHNLSKRV